jgi:hypothetical protein
VWSGIAVTVLAALLFVVSGPLRRRGRASRDRDTRAVESADHGRTAARASSGGQLATRPEPSLAAPSAPAPAPAKARKGKPKDADDDDDLADVADILRRHGIT